MDRLLTEIDRRRTFRDGSLIGEILDYVSGEGFGSTMRRLRVATGDDSIFDNAQRFRDRYVLGALGALGK